MMKYICNGCGRVIYIKGDHHTEGPKCECGGCYKSSAIIVTWDLTRIKYEKEQQK